MATLLAPSILSPPTTLTKRKQPTTSTTIVHKEKPSVETNLSALSTVDDSAVTTLKTTPKSYIIWWSNVEVKNPNNLLERWEWNYRTRAKLTVMVLVHALALLGPWTFNWGAFWVAVILYVVTGHIGLTLSFHRHLTHRSFTLPKWLEYLFAYFGSLVLQGDPIDWVKTHRYHHKFVDTERDPHSPIAGFWYSHVGWIFDTATLMEKRTGTKIVLDMETQPFYKFMKKTYLLHHFALGFLLYALGGFSYVVWGMGVRTTCYLHAIWCVNSVCHVWGNQPWNTGDSSRNNWWVGVVAGGEGWHNNHHAFEYSARHGLEWWQIDVTWYIIKLLEVVGLAKDVKLPTKAHKQRLAFKKEGTLD